MEPEGLIGLPSIVDNLLKNKKYLPLYWLIIAFLVLRADYITGPLVQFPILYLIPIGLASWYNGRVWGLIFAFGMPLIRLYFLNLWEAPWTIFEATINASIRIFVFTIFAYLVDRIVTQKRDLEKEVHILRGILPICSFCKKIRDKDEKWITLEKYITEHSETGFSHGLCPECAQKHYPDYFKE
jgi:hypothetical protein